MSAERVAVIVIHGVADQKPGETVRSVVDLLVASAPIGTAYETVDSNTITLPVDPLPPKRAPLQREDATPSARDRSLRKAFEQSLQSDFHRAEWRLPGRMRKEARPGSPKALHHEQDPPVQHEDRGLAVTDYLLAKHRDNGATTEAYETQRIEVRRTTVPGVPSEIAFYEMYWADLSRLSGAVPRIVSELFTMVFRLSKLGRSTMAEACAWRKEARSGTTGPLGRLFRGAWIATTGLQIALDWTFVHVMALAFAQLLLLSVLLSLVGLVPLGRDHLFHAMLVSGLAGAVVLLIAYQLRTRISLLLIALTAAVMAAAFSLPHYYEWMFNWYRWIAIIVLFGLITVAYRAALNVAESRFPFVRAAGNFFWFAVIALIVIANRDQILASLFTLRPHRPLAAQITATAALFAIEVVFVCIKAFWVGISGIFAAWLICGWVASFEKSFESRASLATGRIGFCASLGGFLVMSMALWALASDVLDHAVKPVGYVPTREVVASLQSGYVAPKRPLAVNEASTVSNPSGTTVVVEQVSPAQKFLREKFAESTKAFSSLAALFLIMAAYFAIMLTPSVLAELKLLARRTANRFKDTVERRRSLRPSDADRRFAAQARQLGRWLTGGLRNLDAIVIVVTVLSFVVGLYFTLLYIGEAFQVQGLTRWFDFVWSDFLGQETPLEQRLSEASLSLLKPMVISAASLAATITLLGGVLSKRLPALRGPLDAALDVDNHFREFPRTNIARARIFARYAALLAHVKTQKFDHIVIVSHSQGTVITAELLRFLSSDGARVEPGARPRLPDGNALPPISLMTLGCPLRQLYAARFPTLYRWVLERHRGVDGPVAADIGVQRWVNAFCSGDYVGRWLWSKAPKRADDDGSDVIGHPMMDTTDDTVFGRTDAYAAFKPMPPSIHALQGASEVEVCLGTGAHTHYFERDQTVVAWMIDHLIAATRPYDRASVQEAPHDLERSL